jgi:hypothetical protein
MYQRMYNRIILLFLLLVLVGTACRKTEFTTISEPSYLRVFNNLDYNINIDNKDAPQPFLTLLVDPELDAAGVPVKASITGDFLDKRASWARPYPDAASTTLYQTEYPGSAKVLAGPVLNGYDLSSWAQIPSGKHRIMFYSRPFSTVPFFELPGELRKQVLIDTTVDFVPREVYTMHVLEQEVVHKTPGIYIRNETFVKQPFSDSLVYINFYNLSSEGFYQYGKLSGPKSNVFNQRIRDTMNVFYTLNKISDKNQPTTVPGYEGILMGSVIRSQASAVTPYYSFPLFPDTSANKIFVGRTMQQLTFLSPGYTPNNNPFLQYMGESNGRFTELVTGPDYERHDVAFRIPADLLTGMIVSIRSGKYLNRSFSTVNTVEYVNGKFYLMTIQRKYDPPIY